MAHRLWEDGHWEFAPQSTRDNGLRSETVLNAFWLRRPWGSSSEYEKVRVPGRSGRDEDNEFYRELLIPESWKKRRIAVELMRVQEGDEIYASGKRLLKAKRSRWYQQAQLPAAKLTGKAVKLRIRRNGPVSEDIWLRTAPAGPTVVEDSYLTTSCRSMNVTVRLEGRGRKGAALSAAVRIYSDPDEKKLVKTFRSGRKFRVRSDGSWQEELTSPWKDPKLWSRWHPNLYYYTVELKDVGGRCVDKLLPRRFGFREIWIENGQFMLNGNPLISADDTWEHATGFHQSMREHADAQLKSLKKMGLSMGFRVKSDLLMDLCDENGFTIAMDVGSLVRLNIWDPKSGLTPMSGNEDIEEIETRIRRWREHPSVFVWQSNAPFSQNTIYGGHTGQPYNPWDWFPGNRAPERAKKAHEKFRDMCDLVAGLDATRVVGTSVSPYSPVEFVTRYLCHSLDLQEREEFFEYWFRTGRPKAVWVHEFGTPFQGHYYLRRTSYQHPNAGPIPMIHMENAAREFGEGEYLAESDEHIGHWKDRCMPQTWLPLFQKMVGHQVYAIWRTWRTYGVCASAHTILQRDCFAQPRTGSVTQRFGCAAEVDPRRQGFSTVSESENWYPMIEHDTPLEAGKAYLRGVSPLCAYIGGPDTRFTNRDHLYYAGARIRKAVIVLNDWDNPARISGTWKLKGHNGKAVASGSIKGTVKAGQRALTEFPIEFNAPRVEKRTDYTLSIQLTSNRPGSLDDSFDITVFPLHKKPSLKGAGTIWRMNISDDRIHERQHFFWNRDNKALLAAAGVKSRLVEGLKQFTYEGYGPPAVRAIDQSRPVSTDGTPQPGDLLIIPRHCLRTDRDDRQLNLRMLESLGLDKLVEDGLRVLVLEQDLDNLFGINTEDVRPRRVFQAAQDHPVFEGLKDSDLSCWTGDSDLCDAHSPISMSERECPDRVWHTSNTNAVATKTLIRPQAGSCRALAVSGFDLAESPLLEVTRGKGRIVFCTMDVTNRYGVDPAATILFDNIIRYMATVGDADPQRSDIEWIKPGSADVAMKKNLYRAAKPQGPDGWGVTRGELFFRESIYKNNRVDQAPDIEIPVLADTDTAGLPAVIRRSGDGTYAMTLDESLFETGWAKKKVAWLRGSLVVNQGGSLPEGPALRHHGRLTDLYPHVWVEGFLHPYSAELW